MSFRFSKKVIKATGKILVGVQVSNLPHQGFKPAYSLLFADIAGN
jgi:hypothetical protein